jgi:hypothetical protein
MSYRETKDDEQLCLLGIEKDKCYKIVKQRLIIV